MLRDPRRVPTNGSGTFNAQEALVWPFTSYRIIKRAILQFSNNRGTQMGAALAYYSLFSIAPLLVIAIVIAGAILGKEQATQNAMAFLGENMAPEAAGAVKDFLDHLQKPVEGFVPTVIAAAILFFGALGVFLQIRTSFCVIWNLPPPHNNSILSWLINYLLASLMVLLTGILLLASVLVTTLLPRVLEAGRDRLPQFVVTGLNGHLLEFGISFFYITLLFAVIYWVMSGRQISLGYVLYGAILGALLFTAGKTVLGIYLARANVASVYGAGGSIVALLIWIYYSSQILILGAELIQARRTRKQWMNAKG
jgi:membrane protein